jgi:UDP-3-O-[3-hydroxymyristoyl] glucosamine N-acyltransferase
MTKKRFFESTGTFPIQELAKEFNCEIVGDNKLTLTDISSLDDAGPGEITIFTNGKYKHKLARSKASACIIADKDAPLAPEGMTLLISDNPYATYAKILAKFYGEQVASYDISEQAYISPGAKIGKKVSIGPGAYIGDGAVIGEHVIIAANSYIGENVTIDNNCNIGPNVVIQYAILGKNVVLHPGVKIGQDGFGYANEGQELYKIKQIGMVMIGNEVEIGAGTCIDRGALRNTVIGDGTKIDNLVQIGHNVQIGRSCIICGQVGIAGSTVIDDGVIIGGQAGISGHITIGKGAKIAAQSGVINNIATNETVGGTPAVEITTWHRQSAYLRQLAKRKNNEDKKNAS